MTRPSAQISPAHPLIREYQRSLADLRGQGVEHELGLRRPFENLLADSARLHGWRFVAEVGAKAGGHRIRPDGTVFDANSLPRGFWESKDSHDDLDREIDRKIRLGYPVGNTIFEDTRRGVLYQNRSPVMEADLSNTRDLADLLFRFYSHTEPEIREFEVAVEEFGQRVPDLARGLALKIEEAHKQRPGPDFWSFIAPLGYQWHSHHVRGETLRIEAKEPGQIRLNDGFILIGGVPARNGLEDVATECPGIKIQSVIKDVHVKGIAVRIWQCEQYSTVLHSVVAESPLVDDAAPQAV
jgi:hypothetical protein